MDFFISGLVKNHQPQKLQQINKFKRQSNSFSNNNSKVSASSQYISYSAIFQKQRAQKHQKQSNLLQYQQNQHNQIDQLERHQDQAHKYQNELQQQLQKLQYKQQEQQDTILVANHFQKAGFQFQDVQDEQVQEVIQFHQIDDNNINPQNKQPKSRAPLYQSMPYKNPFSNLIKNSNTDLKFKSDSQSQPYNDNSKLQFDQEQPNHSLGQDSKLSNYLQINHDNLVNPDHLENAKILQSQQYNQQFELNYIGKKKKDQDQFNFQNGRNSNLLPNQNTSNYPMILSNTRNSIFFPQLKKNYQKTVTQIQKSLNAMRSQHKQFYQKFKSERLQFQQGLIFVQDQILKHMQFYLKRNQFNENSNSPFKEKQQIFTQGLQQALFKKQRQYSIQKKLIKEQYEQKFQYLKQKNYNLEEQLRKNIKLNQLFKGQDQHRINQKAKENQQNLQKYSSQNDQIIKQLKLKIQEFELQSHEKDLIIDQLQRENQNLSEHVFDIEQQVAGLELEVEKKVQEQLLKLKKNGVINSNYNIQENSPQLQQQRLNTINEQSQLEQSINMMNGTHSNTHNLINSYNLSSSYQKNDTHRNQLQRISKQLESYKKKSQFLQLQKKNKQTHFQQRQRIIKIKQAQLQKSEEDLNYQWAELDRQIHRNKSRETQLQLAEQNISKKISELRLRQSQLVEKNRELEDKSKLFEKQKVKIEKSLSLRQQQLQRRSSHNIELQNTNNLSNQMRSPIASYEINSRKDAIEIPQLPIKGSKYQPERDYQSKYSHIDRNNVSMKYKPDKLYENVNHKNSNGNLHRDSNYDSDKFYRQRERERVSYQTGSNYRTRKNIAHQFVLPQSPNKRSRSKSRSHQKNIGKHLYGSHLNQTNSNYKMVGNYKHQIRDTPGSYGSNYAKGGNMTGLGSKLQRLRDQIKKEIDSIK